MPKKNNLVTGEDAIIANAFLLVREGIINNDWNKICDAYYQVSGEELHPPTPPKSRLENIRDLMKDVKPVENQEQELIDELVELGADLETVSKMPKKILEKTLNELRSAKEPMVNPQEVVEQDKGNIFPGKQKIITDGFNPIEAQINKNRSSRQKVEIRNTNIPDIKDENADIRYNNKPSRPPPWH